MSNQDGQFAHLLPGGVPPAGNLRVTLHTGPDNPNVLISLGVPRFRLMVRKEYVDNYRLRWVYRVLDMTLPQGRYRVVRYGDRHRWRQAVDAGLAARNETEQEHAWGAP